MQNILINRYILAECLGKGKYGDVYKAYDVDLQRDVALKFVQEKCVREGEIMTILKEQKSPFGKHAVQLLHSFKYQKQFRIYVQELLYCDLFGAMKIHFKDGYDLEKIASVGLQLCKSLCFFENLEREGGEKSSLVHSDLKMNNVMFADKKCKRIKVLDFGHPFFEDENHFESRQINSYRAPESLFNGKTLQTTAIDMWSVGVMLSTMFGKMKMFQASTEEEQIANLVCVFGQPPAKMVHNKNNLNKFFDEEDGKLSLKPEYLVKAIQKSSFMEMFEKVANDPRHAIKKYSNCLKDFYDLLLKMMTLDPSLRIKPQEAIKHPFFSLAEKKNIFTRLLEKLKK